MAKIRIVVVGSRYCGKVAADVLKKLKAGAPVTLRREPHNSADPGAVACYAEGVKIGYLPRAQYGAIQAALDANKTVTATFRRRPTNLPRITVAWSDDEEKEKDDV